MIKRQASSSPAPAPSDRGGEDKKYRRHGGVFECVRRWMTRNGKFAVACAAALLMSVFFLPPMKLMLSRNSSTIRGGHRSIEDVPPCPSFPWKANEDLRGKCPGDVKPNPDAATISECASSCCTSEECITWQYRKDVGCIQGKDVRLGMEKDGVSAWCSDHPPHRWNGQFLKPHGKTEGTDAAAIRKQACDERTWNANEEVGQCFGLGDVRSHASGSARECMSACCADETCGAWQWNKELGCFYGRGMHSCQGDGDPTSFEPFVGRRKHMESRHYTDIHNKPWQMAM